VRRLIDLDVGEIVRVGAATIELKYKSGRKARLSIAASDAVEIEHVRPSIGKSIGRGPWIKPENNLAPEAAIG
jgi:hypothetical protein